MILGKSNSPFREFLEASLYNPSFHFYGWMKDETVTHFIGPTSCLRSCLFFCYLYSISLLSKCQYKNRKLYKKINKNR